MPESIFELARPRYALRMGWRIAYLLFVATRLTAGALTVATYNLEFYVDVPTLGIAPKSPEGRGVIRESIRQINPDVIALQEVGSPVAFQELRTSLEREGLRFPYTDYIKSADSNLHLAFLSKLPITSRRSHTNLNFLYQGKRHHVSRGFAEIEIAPPDSGRVTLISAHLKSKRQVGDADQQGLREEESLLLREKIDEFFQRQPRGQLIVLGDFNDHVGSRTIRNILTRGRYNLFDPRPAERNGDTLPNPNPRYEPRRIVWTHYYGKEELFSRMDYIFVSANLKRLVDQTGTYVLALPNWGAASDHRPVCVRLNLED